jgi:hypothetical protein
VNDVDETISSGPAKYVRNLRHFLKASSSYIDTLLNTKKQVSKTASKYFTLSELIRKKNSSGNE